MRTVCEVCGTLRNRKRKRKQQEAAGSSRVSAAVHTDHQQIINGYVYIQKHLYGILCR